MIASDRCRGQRATGGRDVIAPSHLDLLERPLLGALTTRMPDGALQTQPVWFDFDREEVRLNTMRGFRKERNMRADRRIALLIVDPDRPGRWIEIRGCVELDETAALVHLDGLARRYAGASRYFGECVPAALAEREVPVLVRLTPARVVTETTANAHTLRTTKTARPRTSGAECSDRIAVIPATHVDLLERPLVTMFSTSMSDGQPQTQPVWSDFDGSHVRVATARERQKAQNIERDPHATVLVVDPADGGRWIEIRGLAELTECGALEHLDELARAYTGHSHYYGPVLPLEQRERETRVICRLHPLRVVCDAIHHSGVSPVVDELESIDVFAASVQRPVREGS